MAQDGKSIANSCDCQWQSDSLKENKENKIKEKEIENLTKEDWRFISSVQRSALGFNPDRIAEHKRDIFRRQTEEVANEIGMTSQQVDAFVRWWTEHSPGSEKIKADYEATFNIKDRAKNWIERDRPRAASQQSKPKSRMDAFEEDMRYIHNFFHPNNEQSVADPDEQ